MFKFVCVPFFLCLILLSMCHIWRLMRLYWRLFSRRLFKRRKQIPVRCSLPNCSRDETQSLWPSRVGACWWCVCQRSPSLCLPPAIFVLADRTARRALCSYLSFPPKTNRKDVAQGANIFPFPCGRTSRVTRFVKSESGYRGGNASVLIHGFNATCSLV